MAAAGLYADEGLLLVGLTWTCAGLATVLFLIRSIVASRAAVDRPSLLGWKWDYIWVAIAYASALVAQSFITVSYQYAVGKTDAPDKQSEAVMLWSIIGTVFNIFSMAFGRLSVIALLLTLHGSLISPGWRRALQILGVLQFAISAPQAFITVLESNSKTWDPTVSGSCPQATLTKQIGYASGAFGAFSDFALAIYPVVLIIGHLGQMKLSLKIAISIIMSGGLVAGTAAIVTSILVKEVPCTGGYGTVLTWSLTQTWFIIIFGSLPTIRPVLVAFGETICKLSMKLKSRLWSREATDMDSWIEWGRYKQSEPTTKATTTTTTAITTTTECLA